MPICDPTLYPSPPKRPSPPPRGRISWLPPLKFQVPAETGHPALQRKPDQQTLTQSQTNLLPESINRVPLPQNTTTAARSPLRPNETNTTSASSVYSRSTSASTLSRGPSTLSSNPSTSSIFSSETGSSIIRSSTSSRPSVPMIPERYLHKSHSLRNGGSPPRPGSRPMMPPADFWTYARRAQQKDNNVREATGTGFRNLPPKMRARAQSEDAAKRGLSPGPYPQLPASPEKAVLKPNMNKGNTMQVGKKTSYEGLRKGARVAQEVDYGRLDAHGRKDSRTLVKMRQPWDEERRGERRRANS